jgi:hypothetical protein
MAAQNTCPGLIMDIIREAGQEGVSKEDIIAELRKQSIDERDISKIDNTLWCQSESESLRTIEKINGKYRLNPNSKSNINKSRKPHKRFIPNSNPAIIFNALKNAGNNGCKLKYLYNLYHGTAKNPALQVSVIVSELKRKGYNIKRVRQGEETVVYLNPDNNNQIPVTTKPNSTPNQPKTQYDPDFTEWIATKFKNSQSILKCCPNSELISLQRTWREGNWMIKVVECNLGLLSCRVS